MTRKERLRLLAYLLADGPVFSRRSTVTDQARAVAVVLCLTACGPDEDADAGVEDAGQAEPDPTQAACMAWQDRYSYELPCSTGTDPSRVPCMSEDHERCDRVAYWSCRTAATRCTEGGQLTEDYMVDCDPSCEEGR